MSFEYKEEYQWLTNVCLNVTDACNLECKYCFVEQNPHFMTYEVAKKAVHFLLENLEKKNKKFGTNEKAKITYFGGEPTLMWDEIIEPLTKYIRENNFPIKLTMTTNGTLLNKDRIKFLKENEVYLLLSIDGAPDTQNFNRPCRDKTQKSFDLVVKNIPYILEAFPNTTFRGTIYAPTAHNTFENYMFATYMGFKNIFLIPDERHSWTEEEKKLLKEELNKIYSYMDYCFTVLKTNPINFSLINESFLSIAKHDVNAILGKDQRKPISRRANRCGLGTAMGAIGYNGNIYGCQEQVSKEEESIFYIGNIDNGIDRDRHIKLLELYTASHIQEGFDEDFCENCPLKSFCHNFSCPSAAYDIHGNFYTLSKIRCEWNNFLFNNSCILMEKLVKDNNLIFKNYLEKECKFERLFKGV